MIVVNFITERASIAVGKIEYADFRRENSLWRAAYDISDFYRVFNRLPKNLDELLYSNRSLHVTVTQYDLSDPAGGYLQYKIIDDNHFFLCTTFLIDAKSHQKGYKCTEYDESGKQAAEVIPTPAIGMEESITTPTKSIESNPFNTIGFTSIESNLWMKINSFSIENGGSIRISVDVVVNGNSDKDIDFSNLIMKFTPPGGKQVTYNPLPSVLKYHLHPPEKLSMELEYYGTGKGPDYSFSYENNSSLIPLGTFR